LFLNHILYLLNRNILIRTVEIEEHTEGGDFSSPIKINVSINIKKESKT
jgi:hypothetical protein